MRARAEVILRRALSSLCRPILRPAGHIFFVFAALALSAAGRLLGDDHELGIFAGRLGGSIWRYPEVTRTGVELAWLAWLALFLLALSPLDPIASRWDEVGLAVLALGACWRQRVSSQRAEHRGS